MRPAALAGIAQAAAQAGDAAHAQAAIAELDRMPHAAGRGVGEELGLARAWTAHVSGDRDRAVAIATVVLAAAEARGADGFAARARAELTRLPNGSHQRRARGRHDPLRGEPDPAGAGGHRCRTASRRRTRASAATAGRSGSRASAVTSVDAHGKHLFLRFEGGLSIHSHLRMTGKWRVRDARLATPPRNTWLVHPHATTSSSPRSTARCSS